MKRVLVLDDDADLCAVMAEMLVVLGVASVLTARSLVELQSSHAEALATDIAILDVNLGAGVPNGVDAYDWLKSQGYGGRVVFFTGHARRHPSVVQALKRPEVLLIEKPVDVSQLEALLQ